MIGRIGVVVVDGMGYRFIDGWKVLIAEKKSGNILERRTYSNGGTYEITDGVNSVKVNNFSSGRHPCFQVRIPSITVDAQKIILLKEDKRQVYNSDGILVVVDTAEGIIVNDVYEAMATKPDAAAFITSIMFNREYIGTILKTGEQIYKVKTGGKTTVRPVAQPGDPVNQLFSFAIAGVWKIVLLVLVVLGIKLFLNYWVSKRKKG